MWTSKKSNIIFVQFDRFTIILLLCYPFRHMHNGVQWKSLKKGAGIGGRKGPVLVEKGAGIDWKKAVLPREES